MKEQYNMICAPKTEAAESKLINTASNSRITQRYEFGAINMDYNKQKPVEDGKSFRMDDQFVCYECGGTISRKELSNLPREHERLGGGVCTWVVCPLCNKRTIGAEWRIK